MKTLGEFLNWKSEGVRRFLGSVWSCCWVRRCSSRSLVLIHDPVSRKCRRAPLILVLREWRRLCSISSVLLNIPLNGHYEITSGVGWEADAYFLQHLPVYSRHRLCRCSECLCTHQIWTVNSVWLTPGEFRIVNNQTHAKWWICTWQGESFSWAVWGDRVLELGNWVIAEISVLFDIWLFTQNKGMNNYLKFGCRFHGNVCMYKSIWPVYVSLCYIHIYI